MSSGGTWDGFSIRLCKTSGSRDAIPGGDGAGRLFPGGALDPSAVSGDLAGNISLCVRFREASLKSEFASTDRPPLSCFRRVAESGTRVECSTRHWCGWRHTATHLVSVVGNGRVLWADHLRRRIENPSHVALIFSSSGDRERLSRAWRAMVSIRAAGDRRGCN